MPGRRVPQPATWTRSKCPWLSSLKKGDPHDGRNKIVSGRHRGVASGGRRSARPADGGVSVDGMRQWNEGGPKNRLRCERRKVGARFDQGRAHLVVRVLEFRALVVRDNEAGAIVMASQGYG